MSNALSIVAVTAVIKDVLENGLVSDAIATSVGDVIVTALPPDRISVGSDERAQINLFLYQVTQNRNADWLSREFRKQNLRSRSDCERVTIADSRSVNPPLALDLHYLLTAYGAKDFEAELLLGYAMQLLHKMPVLGRDVIATALKNASKISGASVLSQALSSVSVSKLAEQIGQIQICSEFFNMEETSKLWSALQTHYRPSTAYRASMVLIESSQPYHSEGFYIVPLAQPQIENVTTSTPEQPITLSNNLLIRGKYLRGEVTRLRLGKKEVLLKSENVRETQISLQIPPDLYAGVQEVQVVHQRMKNVTMSYELVESNVAAFVLHPEITAAVTDIQGSDNDLCSAKITIKFNPKVGKSQRVVLLLNEVSKPHKITYIYSVISLSKDSDSITVDVKNIQPGSYLVRVQVDGAESPLHLNQSGEYDSPQVTIP
ncbi:DUF4255 domain-containing protein [Pelatocladus sp. BLCC-F211]|uniref:DUF4255 domain-containing protein n=1 Tax=Pelatocladus sp. BLCC-F211 TaxID=3342752 RepID=UPI0035B8D150